ncbi:hypothetical protein C1645_734278 [Glomus cerebriforme]|uniref:Galactose oxidase n=1 Tax=Glomus cerebriforme TaxID=658196 RepID=A0A397TA53_9GLOM|nr:hypothetical protein C1645_734278 [Glomus cerebriforme]
MDENEHHIATPLNVNAQLNPSFRKLHSAVLIENRLYIFGGFMDNADPKLLTDPNNVFFYLDMSIPFDTSSLPWRAIPDNDKNLPLESLSTIFTGGVAASIGGINNHTIFFINNESTNATSPVHSYDSQNNLWNTQIISGDKPIGRNQMKVITDYKGKIYLLTGFDFTDQAGVNRTSGMFILDTINLNCVIRDAPISRLGYSATLLPNGIIVYIAGSERNYNIPPNNFNEIYLYDTNNDKWDIKLATGNIPTSDAGISSVLGLDGSRIIVFGGVADSDNFLNVLDLTNYEWFVPEVRGKGPVFNRGEHTANVVGKYMVIAFGSNTISQVKYKSSGESDVLLLDISNDSEYIWTTSFDPTPLTNLNSTSSSPAEPLASSENDNKTIIIGCIIGLILLVSILSVVSAYFFIRYRENIKKTFQTSGSENGKISIPSEYDLSYGKSIK